MPGNEQPAAQQRHLVGFADAGHAVLVELTLLHRVVFEVKAVVLAFVGGEVAPAHALDGPCHLTGFDGKGFAEAGEQHGSFSDREPGVDDSSKLCVKFDAAVKWLSSELESGGRRVVHADHEQGAKSCRRSSLLFMATQCQLAGRQATDLTPIAEAEGLSLEDRESGCWLTRTDVVAGLRCRLTVSRHG
jgi:hypothetical protein